MAAEYRLHKRGKYWYYKLKGEKTFHSTGQTHRDRAIDRVNEIIRDGRETKDTLEAYTKDFFVWGKCKWIATQHAHDKSFSEAMAKLRRGQLDNHILPKWGTTKLRDLNSVDIDAWLSSLTRTVKKKGEEPKIVPLSNQTKNHIKNTFNIVMMQAKKQKLISENPIRDIPHFRDNYRKRDIFTLEEIQKLFPEKEDRLVSVWGELRYAVLHYLMLTTGMRCGEVGAVLWEHIDISKSLVLIVQAIKANNEIGPPKNGPRAAFLPERTIHLLERWRSFSPYPDNDCFVFFGENGYSHLNSKTISRKIRRALKETDIETEGRFLGAHSLRHTYNTRMENVLPEAMLRFMIGHKSAKMTERYLNKSPEEKLLDFLPNKDRLEQVF